ncbi:MAG: helix-turn-helix transcriptional regulator [Bacteroidia bacterium]|jgi:hypothetical protein
MKKQGIQNIKWVIEKTKTGFSAFAEDYPAYTTGKNFPALMHNALEATNLYFANEGVTIKPEQLKFEVDFKQFFNFYRVINASVLAEKIGMNPTLLSQYVQGHKKPSAGQTEKILKGIQRIGKELSEIQLIYRS